MQVVDAGHQYLLNRLDGEGMETLTFVKREGPTYPGNVGHHTGTNLQEVLRACIDRVKYLDSQIHDGLNLHVMHCLRGALLILEERAADRHSRPADPRMYDDSDPLDHFPDVSETIELLPTCNQCGHIHRESRCGEPLR